jgi:hypothetical protein
MSKIEYPSFINVTIKMKGRNEGDAHVWGRARINPIAISSYYEAFEDEGNETTARVTAIIVYGNLFVVNMTIEEVDEMMQNIERGFSINE